jgi:hypothetical protein
MNTHKPTLPPQLARALHRITILTALTLTFSALLGTGPASAGQATLPDGRMYEMVTPPEKNGAIPNAFLDGELSPQVSEDGTRVFSDVGQCFGAALSCFVVHDAKDGMPYEFERSPSGWIPHPLAPAASQVEGAAQEGVNVNAKTAFFSVQNGAATDLYGRTATGAFLDLGPFAEPPSFGEPPFSFAVDTFQNGRIATSDLHHVVYVTGGPFWIFDDTKPTGAPSSYEYEGTDMPHPRLIGLAPGNSGELISRCGTKVGGENTYTYNALSEDGETVYFEAYQCEESENGHQPAVAATSLYARYEHARSELISAHAPLTAPVDGEMCDSSCQAQPDEVSDFQGASADGSRVFFTDTGQLTDKASEDQSDEAAKHSATYCHEPLGEELAPGCNLYESECPNRCADPSERTLVDVSAGDTSPGGPRPRVLGVTAISKDGSHVYFIAEGALTGANAEGNSPASGEPNLYAYERDATVPAGRLKFVATVSRSDEEELWNNGTGGGLGVANVTPDGRFLVFTTHRALTPDDTRTERTTQVYRYDAEHSQLLRLSIGAGDFDDGGNEGSGNAKIVPAREAMESHINPLREDPTMSDDGSYVFFVSPDALVPGALNDVSSGNEKLAENAYAWHEGEVSLISGGKDVSLQGEESRNAVQLLGSDGSGRNVFFETFESLAPADTDTQRDIYDARICTDAEPCLESPTPGEVCGEGTCRPGSGAQPTAFGVPGSTMVNGDGDLLTPASVVVKPKPKSAAQLGAQKLAKALKACRKDKSKTRRSACEKRARRTYGRSK